MPTSALPLPSIGEQRLDTRCNNFDLLRLLCSIQVVIVHGVEHLGQGTVILPWIVSYFPGVPIFFFISGFLISRSYESHSDLCIYSRNRFLRIYPALWVCLAISLILAVALGNVLIPARAGIFWIMAQSTFAQFYNPLFLREFGTGVLNGSLWTISIELQFYIALPLLYRATKGYPKLSLILILMLLSLVINRYVMLHANSSEFVAKLASVMLPTYLYIFLLGVLIQRNYATIGKWLKGKGMWMLVSYVALASIAHMTNWTNGGNNLHPFLVFYLCLTILSLAYTKPTLSQRILHENDISYGVYIYHMPIFNSLLAVEAAGDFHALVLGVALTLGAASISWVMVEKPVLKKKYTLRRP